MDSVDELESGTEKLVWDSRWLDAAIQADYELIVFCFARPNHPATIDYLTNRLTGKKHAQFGYIISALARCEHPEITTLYVDLVRKKTQSAKAFDWEIRQLFDSACYLPAADLPKLDELAGKLDEKFVDGFLEALAPLRAVSQTPTA